MSRTILITGGSRGIGAATARMAAARGDRICLTYISGREAAETVVREITASGGDAFALQADMSSESSIEELFAQLDARVGRIDGLVNNAGTLERQMRVETMSADRLHRIFSINVVGPMLCAREAVKRMSTKHGGRGGAIVNVSSAASKFGSPNEYVDYAASKGAIDVFTVGLAKEVADEGIRVNAVRPGLIYTEIHASGGEANRVERLKTAVPMQRGGQPEEVANAILWLLSLEASYITASILDVSGGR